MNATIPMRHPLRWTLAASLVFICFICACEGDPNPSGASATAAVDTLASGRVVVSNPDPAQGAAAGVGSASGEIPRLEEIVRLGSATAEGPELFGRVVDVELDDEGRIYVLDQQAAEVRVFALDGSWLRTLGGPGEGPGELAVPVGMAVGPDGLLWVLNWRNARYTAYDPDTGEVVREPRRQVSFVSIPWPGTVDARGRLVDVGLDAAGETAALVLDSTYAPVDTLALPQAPSDARIAFVADGVIMMSTPDPFSALPHWAPHPDGGIVVGDGATFELHHVVSPADTLRTVRLLREPAPVTAAERDSALAAFDELRNELQGAQPTREPRVSDTRPAHGPLLVDDLRRLWVRAPGARGETDRFEVFGAEGHHLASVPVPAGMGFSRPVVRGDLLAVSVETDGIPQVVVYRVRGLETP